MPHSSNLLLASLSASDAAAVRPHLKSVHLEHEKILFEAGEEMVDIYFPTGGDCFIGGRPFIGRDNRGCNGRQRRGYRRLRRAWRKHSQQSGYCSARWPRDGVHRGRTQKRGAPKSFLDISTGSSRADSLRASKPIGRLHGGPSCRGAPLPLAAQGERFGRYLVT